MWSSVIDLIVLSPKRQEQKERRMRLMSEHEALLYIISCVGTATYGKERWFPQEDGKWYDRKYCDYVMLDEIVDRLCSTVWESEERAEREDEYVTLHQEDIHFIDEDAERAFYESLIERKEE